MLEFIVTGIVGVLILYFILYFHEFGHAFFALLFTKHEVTIRLGNNLDKNPFKIGRLIVYLNSFNPWYGFVNWDIESLTNIKKIFICLGGPLFSAILYFVLWWGIKNNIFRYVNEGVIQFLFMLSIWQFISTIFPIRYPKFWGSYAGHNSDGLSALEILLKSIKII